jgi:hypothetical protein
MGVLEFAVLPVPAFEHHTVRVRAGVVTFGVEYRHLDEATILEFYGPDSRAQFGGKRPAGMAEVVEEDGLALHVFETATGAERLRFDCFDDAPHWHLLDPAGPRNVVIEHDTAGDGVLVEWALASLRANLPALLRDAGAADVADAVDDTVVQPALDTVEQVARYVVAAGRPVRV